MTLILVNDKHHLLAEVRKCAAATGVADGKILNIFPRALARPFNGISICPGKTYNPKISGIGHFPHYTNLLISGAKERVYLEKRVQD